MPEKNILSMCSDFLFLWSQFVESKDTAENQMWSHKIKSDFCLDQSGVKNTAARSMLSGDDTS